MIGPPETDEGRAIIRAARLPAPVRDRLLGAYVGVERWGATSVLTFADGTATTTAILVGWEDATRELRKVDAWLVARRSDAAEVDGGGCSP